MNGLLYTTKSKNINLSALKNLITTRELWSVTICYENIDLSHILFEGIGRTNSRRIVIGWYTYEKGVDDSGGILFVYDTMSPQQRFVNECILPCFINRDDVVVDNVDVATMTWYERYNMWFSDEPNYKLQAHIY